MAACPAYWDKFIRSLQDDPYRDDISSRDARMEIIQRELARYGARYCLADDDRPTDYVIFEDEKMLSWFAMRWS